MELDVTNLKVDLGALTPDYAFLARPLLDVSIKLEKARLSSTGVIASMSGENTVAALASEMATAVESPVAKGFPGMTLVLDFIHSGRIAKRFG